MGRFETARLTTGAYLAQANLPGGWIDRVHARKPQTTIVLDMDTSVSEMYGAHEGSACNGHFGCTCYHPLFVFNQFGDLERCALRPGNAHSTDGQRRVRGPVVPRRSPTQQSTIYWKPRDTKCTICVSTNSVLRESIGRLLKRLVGRPAHKVRRSGEPFPRVGFIVAKMTRPAERVVAFYNQRGTAEQWIKEAESAVTWTRLSCHRFAANTVWL
jgi:hypothetical protein